MKFAKIAIFSCNVCELHLPLNKPKKVILLKSSVILRSIVVFPLLSAGFLGSGSVDFHETFRNSY